MRNKTVICLVLFVCIIFSINTASAKPLQLIYDGAVHQYPWDILSLKINGETVQTDIPPIVFGERALVPARAVFEKVGAIVSWDGSAGKVSVAYNNTSMEFKINDANAKINDIPVKLEVPAKIINDRTMLPVRFVGEQLDMLVGWLPNDRMITLDKNRTGGDNGSSAGNPSDPADPSDNVSRGDYDRDNQDFGISLTPRTSGDEVEIKIAKYSGYNISRLSDPDRIIIDIPGYNQALASQKLAISSSSVKSVRYAKYDSNTIRVVVDTVGQMDFSAEEKSGVLAVNIRKTPYSNIYYHNNQDGGAYFTIPKASLTDSGAQGRLYRESYDAASNKYTVIFPSRLADLAVSGVMNINDDTMNSASIAVNPATNETSITLISKKPETYGVSTKNESDGTVSTIIRPVAKGPDISNKLVIIDPGHGGSETGAVKAGIYEKNLNLDISKRVNALLKARKVKTYMLREDDSSVGLRDRPDIANDMNAALFLSIHNNANNTYSRGTETLYRPGDPEDGRFTSKRFAQIVHEKLINKLGMVDRGIVPRPNLVVLKYTTMPAVLAEIGFLDNAEDRAYLLRDDFRQKAAEALSDAVIQALTELSE